MQRNGKGMRYLSTLAVVVCTVLSLLCPSEALAATKGQIARARSQFLSAVRARKESFELKDVRLSYSELYKMYQDALSEEKGLWYVTGDFWYYGGKPITIYPEYMYEKPAKYKSFKKKYDAEMAKAVKYVKKYKGSKMRALAAHDWLIRHCKYVGGRDEYSDGYAALVKGKGSCKAYAEAYKAICDKVGIPCKTIWTDRHEWNLVKVEGSWFHVDVSGDDLYKTDYSFLKSTREFKRMFPRYFPNSGGAKCTNTKYDSKWEWKLK